jgi:hypothetical protein
LLRSLFFQRQYKLELVTGMGGDFYIFAIITDGANRILTLRMTLTSLAFLFRISFIFTTFAYVARHGARDTLGHSQHEQLKCRRCPCSLPLSPSPTAGSHNSFHCQVGPTRQLHILPHSQPEQSRAGASGAKARGCRSPWPELHCRAPGCGPLARHGLHAQLAGAPAPHATSSAVRLRRRCSRRAGEALVELLLTHVPMRQRRSCLCRRGRGGAAARAHAHEARRSGCSRAPARPRGSCCSRACPRGCGGAVARARASEAMAELLLTHVLARPRWSCCSCARRRGRGGVAAACARAREQEGAPSPG